MPRTTWTTSQARAVAIVGLVILSGCWGYGRVGPRHGGGGHQQQHGNHHDQGRGHGNGGGRGHGGGHGDRH